MEFRKIQMFVEVVRQQGFTRAAERLFATQSTVSKAVRQLEDELGLTLLDRGGRGVVPTPAGEVVYRRGLRLLAEHGDMQAELAALQGLERGVLRLGLPQIGANALFAPVFADYRQRFPGIEIRLEEHGSDQLETMLRAGEVELGASLLPVAEDFDWQPVRCEPLVALVSESAGPGSATDGEAVTFDALRRVPFILFEEGFALNRLILAACRRRGFEPEVVARSSQIDFICELAAAGLGAAFLPRFIAQQRRVPGLRLVGLDEPGTDWDMAVVWRRGAFLSHAARAWVDVVRERYGDGRK